MITENETLKPMLIGLEMEPFNDPNYIYELKLDGERCLAFLDKTETVLRNKRSIKMLGKFPELSQIHKQVKKSCVLDGELIVISEGQPNFYEVQRRSIMTNSFKIQLASSKLPATYTAFDILYYDGEKVTDLPLIERKKLLEKNIKENERIAISRYIEENGIELYKLTKQQNLEGIVAKRKESKYYFDKRTKDWVKIKYLKDDDYVICGYIIKDSGIISIVLGQYREKNMTYKGHVTMGMSSEDFKIIAQQKETGICPFYEMPKGNENAIWFQPNLVCKVKFMMKTDKGSLRQPVYKGLRFDKKPIECIE